MNELEFRVSKPRDSSELLYHLQTAKSAYEALKENGAKIYTTDQIPIDDSAAFLRYIGSSGLHKAITRVEHPILGGRWNLHSLERVMSNWDFGGDHSCETCNNLRFSGQLIRGQPSMKLKLSCPGEKTGGNNGPIPCQYYRAPREYLDQERDEQLPGLIERAISADPKTYSKALVLRYQLAGEIYDFEHPNDSQIISELHRVVEDFIHLRSLFRIKTKPDRGQSEFVTGREELLTLLQEEQRFSLRSLPSSSRLSLTWDVSQLNQVLLMQERQLLLRLIEYVIKFSSN